LVITGCSILDARPELTEAEAIQLVQAYLDVKTYSQTSEQRVLDQYGKSQYITISREESCARFFPQKSKFKATWILQTKTWLVTYPYSRDSDYTWTVYEKTRVVEAPPGIKGVAPFLLSYTGYYCSTVVRKSTSTPVPASAGGALTLDEKNRRRAELGLPPLPTPTPTPAGA